MKPLLYCLALLAAALPAWAQGDAAEQAERARIEAGRKQAESQLVVQERACYRTFAVTDCLKAARAARRDRLTELRRQELVLNDAERKRRAQEQLRSLEERNSPQKEQENAAQRAEAVARQRDKQQAQAERAAERAQNAASAPVRAARTVQAARERQATTRSAREQRVHNATEELRQSQERQQQAKERQERVARRQAEAAKSGIKPLPVPP
ncbi:hypothetical protein ACFPOE_21085 [Caenimonas terrae]|uniref:Uncharacterized protein n=1 Tax=Caenimonas terrae TaxID=696074 RepID=A0ABW0NJ64_9BURK